MNETYLNTTTTTTDTQYDTKLRLGNQSRVAKRPNNNLSQHKLLLEIQPEKVKTNLQRQKAINCYLFSRINKTLSLSSKKIIYSEGTSPPVTARADLRQNAST